MDSLTVNLMVKSVNESIDFYVNILGFELGMTVPDDGELIWAMLTREKVSIMLQEEQSIKEEYAYLADYPIAPSFTMFVSVDNARKLYNQIKDKVQILIDYHQTSYGTNEFAICDNNGYVLAFAQQIATE